ncbi:acyltransferase [bacterium]|nr:acyltransferase [bacterium]
MKGELLAFVTWFVSAIPGHTGTYIRRSFWSHRLKSLGTNARIGVGVNVWEPSNIRIGRDFTTLQNCTLAATGGGQLTIGDNVSLNSNVSIDAGENGVIRIGSGSGIAHNGVLRSSSHEYENPYLSFKDQGHRPGSIIVEEDCWVAANVTLLPGTILRRGCIVASGSVVGGEFPEFTVIAGFPARAVGKRGSKYLGKN